MDKIIFPIYCVSYSKGFQPVMKENEHLQAGLTGR